MTGEYPLGMILTPTQVFEELGFSKGTTKKFKLLRRLATEGLVKHCDEGWVVTNRTCYQYQKPPKKYRMPKNRIGRFYMCTRKRKHTNKDSALESANSIMEKENIKLSVYQCQVCSGWHLTSKC